MTNSVDPDEMAHYEPSHLDLHCLHRYLFWSTGLKGLKFSGYNVFQKSLFFHKKRASYFCQITFENDLYETGFSGDNKHRYISLICKQCKSRRNGSFHQHVHCLPLV